MMEGSRGDKFPQNIFLTNREHIEISGVDDVNSYDEHKITAFTTLGFLTINGESMKIKNFNNQTKELSIYGKVDEILYSEHKKKQKLDFLGWFFK